MISIEVTGAFDFLPEETKIGTLSYERTKGEATYLFEYEPEFLKRFPGTVLSHDVGLFMGLQSTRGGIFSFLSDACPDRWGRALIDKKEAGYAKQTGKPPRTFGDFDYMVRLDDRTRMGALRFAYNGKFIGTENQRESIPIVADLKDIIRESQAYEKALRENKTPEDTWVNNLWKQGSSLGGTRPKANVTDNGIPYIAKIPSIKDTYDVALWEHFAMKLAKKAGIAVPQTRLILLPNSEYHTLLSERFDRIGGKRIHYASSLTLTGLKDGDGADTNKGYQDIANAIIGSSNITGVQDNLEQLYRRIAFNIIIGNHDDHFRNHGFVLTKDGWTLSPAFDMNPTNQMFQSLAISNANNQASLDNLLQVSESYFIERNIAEKIIREVKEIASLWRQTAKDVGISTNEQQRFAKRLDCFVNDGI